MANGATTWVTVKEAADELGMTEAKIRSAYRAGKLTAQDVRVSGRVRKMVALEEVQAWAGGGTVPMPAEEPAVPTAAAAVVSAVPAAQSHGCMELAELAQQAMERAMRAENQVAFLRNELAQLRESHLRIQADNDRRNAEQFRATARLACANPTARSSRTGLRRIMVWRASA